MYTSISLKQNDIQMLDRIVSVSGKTRSRVIADILRKLADFQNITPSFRRVQYQERRKGLKLHLLHIHLNEAEYELFIDMRKFFKKSVSFLVSIAIEKYLSNFSLSKGLKTNTHTDNYQNYIISYKKLNGAICWNIYWGMPECSEMPFLLRA